MPSFSTEVTHKLGKEKAVERLQGFLEQVRERYKQLVTEYQGDWQDNVLTFALTTYGFKINGTLTVGEDVVNLNGTLPFPAVAFRGKIEQSIAEELRRELS